MDERWRPGALIRCKSQRMYYVIAPEERAHQNYGRAGGTLDAGLFVRAFEGGRLCWLSPANVEASCLVIAAPSCPDAYDEAA